MTIWNNKTKGSIIAFVGYILSPLSFWNDWFVNIPIAYACGTFFGLFSRKLFLPGMICGYLITNILGLILLHKGICLASGAQKDRKTYWKEIAFTLVYAGIIVILYLLKIIRLPSEY